MPKKPVKIKVEEFKEELLGGIEEEKMEEKHVLPKPSCSLSLIFLVLGIIAILAIVGLFIVRKNGLNWSIKKTETPAVVSGTIESEGKITIKVTDKEINDGITKSGGNFPIKTATSQINNEGISIKGKTSNSIFGLGVIAIVLPKAENGSIKWEITSIKSAGLEAPKAVRDPINNQLGPLLESYVPSADNIDIQSINMHEGYFDIIGTAK